MSLIWATRGRDWGFRFLRDGGCEDPLEEYDSVFSVAGSDESLVISVQGYTGLRFPDPLERRDRADRLIPHEFILLGGLGAHLQSVDEGREFVWPLVADEYAAIWLSPTPPG